MHNIPEEAVKAAINAWFEETRPHVMNTTPLPEQARRMRLAITAALPFLQRVEALDEAAKIADELEERTKLKYASPDGEECQIVPLTVIIEAAKALRALPFLPVQGAVKKLEWVDADEGMRPKWRAAALGGHYELVYFYKDDPGFAVNFHWGRPFSFWFIQGDPDEWGITGPKIFPTIEAAKSAAQADFEARILSALEPSAARELALEA